MFRGVGNISAFDYIIELHGKRKIIKSYPISETVFWVSNPSLSFVTFETIEQEQNKPSYDISTLKNKLKWK